MVFLFIAIFCLYGIEEKIILPAKARMHNKENRAIKINYEIFKRSLYLQKIESVVKTEYPDQLRFQIILYEKDAFIEICDTSFQVDIYNNKFNKRIDLESENTIQKVLSNLKLADPTQKPKPTKDQMKIALKKIAVYQNENKTVNKIEDSTLKQEFKEVILKLHIDIKETDPPVFKNEQMLLNLYDIGEEIKLKKLNDSVLIEEDFNILFKNKIISINSELVDFALSYEELNTNYQLEAKTLIQEIIRRFGEGYSNVSEKFIVDFFEEIIKQYTIQKEKVVLKVKVLTLEQANEIRTYPAYWKGTLTQVAERGESIKDAYEELKDLEFLT